MLLLFSQIAVLATVAYQDFKSRAIAWYLPILLLLLSVLSYAINGVSTPTDWLLSVIFLLSQFVLVYLYFSIKNRTLKLPFMDHLLGWGDVLFLLVMVPFFSFNKFVLYYSMSLVFALSAHLLFRWRARHKEQEVQAFIPLLGWLGLFFIGVLVFEYVSQLVR